MLDDIRHTRLGRKDHYIVLACVGAVAALTLLLLDLMRQLSSLAWVSTGPLMEFIVSAQGVCCLVSFLSYVYRSLAGRPGLLNAVSVVSVVANLVLLLARSVHEIVFAGYRPEAYSDTASFDDVFSDV